MVATNIPMATNDTESPMASATGPHFCSDAAVPSTMGRIGNTQGESIESVPATKASTRLPSIIGPGPSQDLAQQCGNGIAI